MARGGEGGFSLYALCPLLICHVLWPELLEELLGTETLGLPLAMLTGLKERADRSRATALHA